LDGDLLMSSIFIFLALQYTTVTAPKRLGVDAIMNTVDKLRSCKGRRTFWTINPSDHSRLRPRCLVIFLDKDTLQIHSGGDREHGYNESIYKRIKAKNVFPRNFKIPATTIEQLFYHIARIRLLYLNRSWGRLSIPVLPETAH